MKKVVAFGKKKKTSSEKSRSMLSQSDALSGDSTFPALARYEAWLSPPAITGGGLGEGAISVYISKPPPPLDDVT